MVAPYTKCRCHWGFCIAIWIGIHIGICGTGWDMTGYMAPYITLLCSFHMSSLTHSHSLTPSLSLSVCVRSLCVPVLSLPLSLPLVRWQSLTLSHSLSVALSLCPFSQSLSPKARRHSVSFGTTSILMTLHLTSWTAVRIIFHFYILY